MNDDEVAALLDSDEPLVVIEAPAGCGKTYQGAKYASRVAAGLERGRVLILTHTHAACGVFAKETRLTAHKVEVRTIDSLIVQIASAYHKSLELPANPAVWARRAGVDGFEQLAAWAAGLLSSRPMISSVLADRYPVIIGDEHQDTTADQHAVMIALHRAGSRLRVFGDPMQRIYGGRTKAAVAAGRARWEKFKASGASGELETPHRWSNSSPDLGQWIMQARTALKEGRSIDLGGTLPPGLSVIYADNIARTSTGYQVNRPDRRVIDAVIRSGRSILVLTGQNETAAALRAFWNRSIPIWEGHKREALGEFVDALSAAAGDATAVCRAVLEFLNAVTVGFTPSSHGNRMMREVQQGGTGTARGKPAHLQELARIILEQPGHLGAANCLRRLAELRENRTPGFEMIQIDHRSEFRDALRLADFADPEEGFAEIHRRRSFARPTPPDRAISTIHKAKGLQCDNAIILPCDFSATDYSRCRLYVALSRAKHSLTLVLSRSSPSPLFQ